MANTETLSVTLPAELLAEVRGVLANGEYSSSSEIVRDALEQWIANRPTANHSVEELRKLWQESIDDGEPYIPMEEVMDRLEAKYRALAAEQKKG